MKARHRTMAVVAAGALAVSGAAAAVAGAAGAGAAHPAATQAIASAPVKSPGQTPAEILAQKQKDLAANEAELARDEAEAEADAADWSCEPGLKTDTGNPGTGGMFVGDTAWVVDTGTDCVWAYAGQAGRDDPTDGAVFIMRSSNATGDLVSTPGSGWAELTGAGHLTAIGGKGAIMRVRDERGAIHRFDVTTVKFLD